MLFGRKWVLLRHLSGALEARRLAARIVRGSEWQWDLSAWLDAVTPSLVAPGDGLDELVSVSATLRASLVVPEDAWASMIVTRDDVDILCQFGIRSVGSPDSPQMA
jgi:hypothetical protein